jgi:hypothetical protein
MATNLRLTAMHPQLPGANPRIVSINPRIIPANPRFFCIHPPLISVQLAENLCFTPKSPRPLRFYRSQGAVKVNGH